MTEDNWHAQSGHRTHSSARRMPAPDGMSGLDQLLAYEYIRQLANRYALAVNMRDLDALVELFVDDVRVAGGRNGRAALKETFQLHMDAAEVDVLEVTTHVINLLGADHAQGTVYSRCEMGSRKGWARQSIVYEDRYERREQIWYFVTRNHLLFYGLELPERPLDQPAANWPEHVLGRGSLPYDWPSWQASRSPDGSVDSASW